MKIGIVTFWTSNDNYGQLIQGLALQHWLNQRDYSAEIIRYQPHISPQEKGISNSKLTVSYISLYLRHKLTSYRIRIHQKKYPRDFAAIRDMYMRFSKIISNEEELRMFSSKYDILIAGSDQIWSRKTESENRYYSLGFCSHDTTKKIAYAASLGGKNVFTEQEIKWLSELDAIGMRESTGIEALKGYLDSTLHFVCDPSMLLKKTDYYRLFDIKGKRQRDTLFSYIINWEMNFDVKMLPDIADNLGLALRYYGAHGSELYPLRNRSRDYSFTSWMSTLMTSSLVITNSFHGTLMSIIAEVDFVVIPLSGSSEGMNERFYSLLNKLGLEGRMANDIGEIESIAKSKIDWTETRSKVQEFRLASEDFLNNNLVACGSV